MEVRINGNRYRFPDDMTPDEALSVLQSEGVVPLPELPVEPVAEMSVPVPVIPPAAELAESRQAARLAAVAPEIEARQQLTPEGELFTEEERLLQRERRRQERERRQVLQPGREDPRRVSATALPQFRPSRIIEREIPAVLPSGEILTERVYVDPSGEERPATAADETAEAFALQTVFGAESARQLGQRIAADQAEVDRRIAEGEDVGVFEFAGPALSGILTEAQEAAGVVETELGAALRSTLGWVSALAAEGYFRGLGYEVDRNGVPVDPDDFGVAIAQARRTLGVPDVVYPLQAPSLATRELLGQVSPEAARAFEDWVKAIPQVAVPTPGVATESQQRKVTTFDPEGRRRVAVMEVPNPLVDFAAWKEAEQARIARNVAAGRTMGDEFLDAPAVRDWYASVWGDPDAAYYAGSLAEVFVPAGPGTAAKGAAKAAKAATQTKAAAKAAQLAIRAAEATKKGDMKGWGRTAKAAQAAALQVANPVADIAAALTPGKASDGRLVRRVAESVLRAGALPEAAATRAARAIQAGSDTVEAVVKDVTPVLGDRSDYFARQLRLNVPDDVVMITANVGVPRVHADTMRRSLSAFRRQVFSDSPQAVLDRLPDALAGELRAFERWQDVPADLRLQATTLLEDAHAIAQAPKHARLSRDLTAAQTYVSGQVRGLDLVLKSRALQTPAARRAKAILGPRFLEQETAAVARARADIRAAAQTELSRIGKRMAAKARDLGSADEAVDAIFVEEIAGAPTAISPKDAWLKVMGAIYGDESKAQRLFSTATGRGLLPEGGGVMPTVDALRAVDQGLLKTNVRDLAGVRGTSKLTSWLAPDYQKALLKVAVDEGTKKRLAAKGRYTEQLGSAIEKATAQAAEVPAGADRFIAALTEARPIEVPRLRSGSRLRQRVYDVQQSHAERALAENGEEFAEFIESLSPRARASLSGVLGEVFDFMIGTGRRNVVSNATYGYVLPNVVGFPYALFRQALTPLLTVGLRDSADIVDRVIRRRILGGGLTTRDGVYYTGKQLQELGEQTGLGYSTVSAERVHSLADDLLRDARRAAEGKLEGAVKQELNPLDKSFWTRTAEAVEMSMRQAAFEAELVKGATVRQAADTARRTFFDYSEVPSAIRQTVGKYVATAAANSKLFTELLLAAMEGPQKARMVLKAKLQQARAQDPYNLHGDKALKSMGLIKAGDGVYFGPELPGFAAAETALAMAREGDLLAKDLRQAVSAARQVGSFADQVVEGSTTLTRSLTDDALPAVWRAFEAFSERGLSYQTQGLQGAQPVSDEQMLWAAALYAHHIDQDRSLGAWDWFERTFKPERVMPPKQLAHPDDPQYWTQAPKGMPHILWGRDERNLPLYMAFEMSKDGEQFMKAARLLSPNAIDNLLVAGTSIPTLKPGEEPVMVYGGDALPDTLGQAGAELLLERAAVGDAETARRQQIEQIREVMTSQ